MVVIMQMSVMHSIVTMMTTPMMLTMAIMVMPCDVKNHRSYKMDVLNARKNQYPNKSPFVPGECDKEPTRHTARPRRASVVTSCAKHRGHGWTRGGGGFAMGTE